MESDEEKKRIQTEKAGRKARHRAWDPGRRAPSGGGAFSGRARQFLSILGLAVKNAYTGIVTPKEALSDAQMQFSNYFKTPLGKL